MKITNEMNDIAHGIGAFCAGRALVFQDRYLFRQRAHNAALFAAEALERAFRRTARNVDVVPRAVFAVATNIVCPGGSIAQGITDRRAAVALYLGIDRVCGQ